MDELIMILSTTDNYERAEEISKILVEEKKAACVSIIPTSKSTYWWKGKLEESKEYLILIKTLSNFSDDVKKRLKELHNYEIPEIVEVKVKKCSKDYLSWVESTLLTNKK